MTANMPRLKRFALVCAAAMPSLLLAQGLPSEANRDLYRRFQTFDDIQAFEQTALQHPGAGGVFYAKLALASCAIMKPYTQSPSAACAPLGADSDINPAEFAARWETRCHAYSHDQLVQKLKTLRESESLRNDPLTQLDTAYTHTWLSTPTPATVDAILRSQDAYLLARVLPTVAASHTEAELSGFTQWRSNLPDGADKPDSTASIPEALRSPSLLNALRIVYASLLVPNRLAGAAELTLMEMGSACIASQAYCHRNSESAIRSELLRPPMNGLLAFESVSSTADALVERIRLGTDVKDLFKGL